MPAIGAHIIAARAKKGLTQNKLAELTGLSRSYICDIENDRYSPSLATLIRLATALEMDLKFLTENDGNTSSLVS